MWGSIDEINIWAVKKEDYVAHFIYIYLMNTLAACLKCNPPMPTIFIIHEHDCSCLNYSSNSTQSDAEADISSYLD